MVKQSRVGVLVCSVFICFETPCFCFSFHSIHQEVFLYQFRFFLLLISLYSYICMFGRLYEVGVWLAFDWFTWCSDIACCFPTYHASRVSYRPGSIKSCFQSQYVVWCHLVNRLACTLIIKHIT